MEARTSNSRKPSKVALLALAELNRMQRKLTECFFCFLEVGKHWCWEVDLDLGALSFVMSGNVDVNVNVDADVDANVDVGRGVGASVLAMIEMHGLELDILKRVDGVISLIHLVGLQAASDFFVEHVSIQKSDKDGKESSHEGKIPIKAICAQLENYPKIYLFFLHVMFSHREDYVVTTKIDNPDMTDLYKVSAGEQIWGGREGKGRSKLRETQIINKTHHHGFAGPPEIVRHLLLGMDRGGEGQVDSLPNRNERQQQQQVL